MIISTELLRHYHWNVGEYWIFSTGKGIDPGNYTPEEMSRSIACLAQEEAAECFCLFGSKGKGAAVCKTKDEFLDGTTEIAFFCYDAHEYALYSKEIEVLQSIFGILMDAGISEKNTLCYFDWADRTDFQ